MIIFFNFLIIILNFEKSINLTYKINLFFDKWLNFESFEYEIFDLMHNAKYVEIRKMKLKLILLILLNDNKKNDK